MFLHYPTLLLALGLTNAILIHENVVFQKINEVTTTRSRWLITFVIDLEPFELFLAKLNTDFDKAQRSITLLKGLNEKHEDIGFLQAKEFFKGIIEELNSELRALHSTYLRIRGTFVSLQHLQNRDKRSLLPFVGSALSFLFGTVSEADLGTIRNNIKTLASNQNKLTHVVKDSLTLINTTRTAVAENRVAINELLAQLQLIETKLAQANDLVLQELLKLSMFSRAYMKLDRLAAELGEFMRKAMNDLESLQLQLNMLSLGHLSPSTINPTKLREVLLEIKSHLPFYLTLPEDPEKDLWDFYNMLTCRTVLDGKHIYTVVSLPLLDANSKFEIYRAHNLPTPMNTSVQDGKGMLAKYKLSAQAIAINGDRTKFALLQDSELQSCADPFRPFCKFHSPIYPINLSNDCMVALFLKKSKIIRDHCTTLIQPFGNLPLATYLYSGTWIISTVKTLEFTVVCQTSNLRDSTITVKPPLGVLKLPTSCTAANDYLFLPAFYHQESKYEITDPYDTLIDSFNDTTLTIWKPFQRHFTTFNASKLPNQLKLLPEFPLNSLIDQLNTLGQVESDTEWQFPKWGYILVGTVSIVLITVMALIVYKFSYVKGLLARFGGNKLGVNPPTEGRVTFSNAKGEMGTTQSPSAPLLTITQANDQKTPRSSDVETDEKDTTIYPKLLTFKNE